MHADINASTDGGSPAFTPGLSVLMPARQTHTHTDAHTNTGAGGNKRCDASLSIGWFLSNC